MLQSHFFRFDFHFRYTSKRWYREIEKITTFVAFQSKHLKNPSFYSTSKFAHKRLQKGFKTFLISLKQFSASHVKISTTMCAKNPPACGAPKCVAKSLLSHLWNNIEFLFHISTSNFMLRFCLIYETKWTFTFPISFGNLCRNLALESYLTSGVTRRMGISSHFHSQALDYETQPSFIFASLMKQNETSVKVEMMRKTYNLMKKLTFRKRPLFPKLGCYTTPLCALFDLFKVWNDAKERLFDEKWSFRKRLVFAKPGCYTTPLCAFFWLFQSLKWW